MSVFKELYDVLNDLADLAKKYENQEMASKVVEIQAKFFDIREEIEEVKDENRELKETINQMRSDKELEKDLVLDEQGFYIRKSEKEQGKVVLYCAACWNNNHKLMPLMGGVKTTRPQCCSCHTVYKLKDDINIGRIVNSLK